MTEYDRWLPEKERTGKSPDQALDIRAEDELVGCHHQLNGHELQQTMEYGEGQEIPECCSPWGPKESDTTQQLNNNI